MRLMVSTNPTILPSLLPTFAPWLGTLVTPSNGQLKHALRLYHSHGIPWACDNDCFGGLDSCSYRRMLRNVKGLPGCLWVAVPDVVADATATLNRWSEWSDEVADTTGHPPCLVLQDGAESLELPWHGVGAVFVGGSTEWKLSSYAASLVNKAKQRGLLVHMGRVNSKKRYKYAFDIGCYSLDGTNVCKWPDLYIPAFLKLLSHLDEQIVMKY